MEQLCAVGSGAGWLMYFFREWQLETHLSKFSPAAWLCLGAPAWRLARRTTGTSRHNAPFHTLLSAPPSSLLPPLP